MLVIDMGEEELHTLRLLRAVIAHAIVGLVLEVDVDQLVLVQQLHLLASRLQHLLRHFRIGLVRVLDGESLADEFHSQRPTQTGEEGIVETEQLTRGEMLEREVGLQADAMVAHLIAQVKAQHLQLDVEIDVVVLAHMAKRSLEEAVKPHVLDGCRMLAIGYANPFARHLGQGLLQFVVVCLVGFQELQFQSSVTYLLGVLLLGEDEDVVVLVAGDGIADVALARLDDAHQDHLLVPRVVG